MITFFFSFEYLEKVNTIQSKASLRRYTLEQRTEHVSLSPGTAFIEAFNEAFICLFVSSPIRLKKNCRGPVKFVGIESDKAEKNK